MRIFDRYILAEVVKAVGAGLLLFVGLVVCVHQLQGFIRLLVRQGYPPGAAIETFVCFLPRTIAWVLPIAMIFGVLLAIGRLSSDGELTAMHAGGISFRRVLVPVAVVGLVGVGVLHLLLEHVSPKSLTRAKEIGLAQGANSGITKGFVHSLRDDDENIDLVITAAKLSPTERLLEGVLVAKYRDGTPWMVIRADRAVWTDTKLVMEGVFVPIMPPPGESYEGYGAGGAESGSFPVGLPPFEKDGFTRSPEIQTTPQMRDWIAKQQAAGASHNRNIAPYLQEIATRRADPWCVLGFALVSAPLGLRRIRSSTGVSLGMAVLVFMPYYFVAFTLQVINKHGGISPEIPAWTGNILLYIVAASLILDKSR
ncbi:MAG TPA: LptF/LptG family permease [Armatimonadota bacterium]|nr:LptF/LptG family permease [Armatimonadota bacterium]